MRICLISVALLFMLSLTISSAGSASAETEKISIGVSVPLTGEAAAYGVDVKNAIVFANKVLGNDRYKLIIEDDKCDGKEAASIAQKFVSVDKVKYVLGFGCSGALLAAAPIYEKAQVVVIDAAASAAKISQAGDYIFRVCPSDETTADVLYKYISARHHKFGILSEETEYAQGLAKGFLAHAAQDKFDVTNESFLPGTDDFRPILLKFKAAHVDGLFIDPQAEPGFIRILKQLKEINWQVPTYGHLYPSSPTLLSAVRAEAENIIFTDFPFMANTINAKGAELYRQFHTEFGEPNSSDFYFVVGMMSFNALDEAIVSGANVKDYLYQNSFDKIVDSYSFDRNGDIIGIGYVLKTIHDGKPVPLTKE